MLQDPREIAQCAHVLSRHRLRSMNRTALEHHESFIYGHISLQDYSSKVFSCFARVMVTSLAFSAVDRGFEPRSGQTKDYQIGMCCFSAKHAALRRKSRYWLAQSQDSISEWGDMSIRGLLYQ